MNTCTQCGAKTSHNDYSLCDFHYTEYRKTGDIHNLININSSPEDRDKYKIGPYYLNSAQCLKCGDVLRSKTSHDFVYCGCKSTAVDGGSWYLRRVGNIDDRKELSILFNNQ